MISSFTTITLEARGPWHSATY